MKTCAWRRSDHYRGNFRRKIGEPWHLCAWTSLGLVASARYDGQTSIFRDPSDGIAMLPRCSLRGLRGRDLIPRRPRVCIKRPRAVSDAARFHPPRRPHRDKTDHPPLALHNLNASYGFRPHGLHFDNSSSRLYAVSHSDTLKEESIYVFDVNLEQAASVALRSRRLSFRYLLTSPRSSTTRVRCSGSSTMSLSSTARTSSMSRSSGRLAAANLERTRRCGAAHGARPTSAPTADCPRRARTRTRRSRSVSTASRSSRRRQNACGSMTSLAHQVVEVSSGLLFAI